MQEGALWGWLGPGLVAVFGAFLRFFRLDDPHSVVFDETYYAKDAYSLLKYGVERTFLGDNDHPVADQRLVTGNLDIFKQCAEANDCASYVAHPPLGKWMIGLGEWMWGMNPFGWRFMAAVVGALSILIIARLARRMTRSTLLGCFAGLLLSLDGLHFVLSRTALLDIFLMFWVLAGFACLVVDRDKARQRLADWHAASALSERGPKLGWRPWRIAAGVCLGAACAVKWSGVFFLAAFIVLALVWDMGARRAVGLRKPYVGTFSFDFGPLLAALAVVPGVTFLLSWTGWFVTGGGYGRNWAQATSSGPMFFVLDSVRSWAKYQIQVLGYHTGLQDDHPYKSEPWDWPLLTKPVSFHYKGDLPQTTCGGDKCSQYVLGVGTPAIWYAALFALIGLIVWYIATRDWRAGATLLVYAAGWLPWFYYAIADNRTMYLFYMIPIVPFMVLALTMMAGLVLGKQDATPMRRAGGGAAVGAFALVVLINFWWLYPVLSSETIARGQWWARMLFRSWV
ncbi:phospholipid carrier-dependent glycosyltransferase [Nonomuraea sp. NBC_01738]|uniref:dolichyl-phosphate-mannose--protein mannosyltransferase n=1 Tax=Nonomuraea sp. NBC_01738 TaxID=2976003 RepID=UPI002E110553|nr:phospholipid carrier-dependent glycosyltransferase [Nonomuraea sp. NBC_01738]